MPQQLLSIGEPTVLLQNETYTLPYKLCYITGTGALESSMNGSTWLPFTSGSISGSTFIRSTAANTTILCKEGTIILT